MADIVIFGAGDMGECIADSADRSGEHRAVGFVDDWREPGEVVAGLPVLGAIRDLKQIRTEHPFSGGIVSFGDNFRRSQGVDAILEQDPDFQFVSVIDPTASIGGNVSIGRGTFIMAGVVINWSATIGEHALLCTRASLDHHAVMEDFSSIAPNVATGGRVRIGAMSAICMGATINHGLTIGEHTVVGAGSTVVHDVRDGVVAMGTPCRTVRPRSIDDPYL